MKKNLFFILLITLNFGCANTTGQAPSESAINAPNSYKGNEELLGKQLDMFGTIMGAWFIDRECEVLGGFAKQEFQYNVREINKYFLERGMKNTIAGIISASEEVAKTPPYSNCDKKSQEIVIQSTLLARAWGKDIRGLQK